MCQTVKQDLYVVQLLRYMLNLSLLVLASIIVVVTDVSSDDA